MLATSIAALLVAGAGAVPCENLRSLATPQAAITNVDVVPAGVRLSLGTTLGGSAERRMGGDQASPRSSEAGTTTRAMDIVYTREVSGQARA